MDLVRPRVCPSTLGQRCQRPRSGKTGTTISTAITTTGACDMPYRRGDVVLVPFPFAEREARKTRPAVVVNRETYEATTGSLIVAMVTSRDRGTRFDVHLAGWESARLLHDSWVRAKLATLSAGSIRFSPGRITPDDLEQVDRLLRDTVELG